MANMGRGQYPVKGLQRNLTEGWFRFVGNATAPATIVDPGSVIASSSRSAAGSYHFVLRDRWKYVMGQAQAMTTTDTRAKVDAVVEGSAAANQIQVHCVTGAGTADDLVGSTITVHYSLSR